MSNTPLLGSFSDVGGSSLMFRNAIINGNFDIWQRGTSQTASGYGSDDRWLNDNNNSSKTHTRQTFALGQTDVPGNPKYFSRTVVSSLAGSSNYTLKLQRIEDVKTYAGRPVTLSFWAKADAAKNIATEFTQQFGSGGSPSSAVESIGVTTFSLTTNWKYFTTTVNIPSISGKTLGTGNNDYLQLIFWFEAGSNFNARTNSLGQQSGTFDIAQVQLEAGPVATPFEQRPIGLELALCQRYFIGDIKGTLFFAPFYNNARRATAIFLPVQMRANAVVTGTIVGGDLDDALSGTFSFNVAGNKQISISNSSNITVQGSNQLIWVSLSASAEL